MSDDANYGSPDAIDPADLGDAFEHYLERGFVEEVG